jgi:hypothetical protein
VLSDEEIRTLCTLASRLLDGLDEPYQAARG